MAAIFTPFNRFAIERHVTARASKEHLDKSVPMESPEQPACRETLDPMDHQDTQAIGDCVVKLDRWAKQDTGSVDRS